MKDKLILDTYKHELNNRKMHKVHCLLHDKIYTQRSDSFKTQNGCPVCKVTVHKKSQVKSLDYHIELFRKCHKDLYDYSKVVYVDSKTNIEIICKEHGSYWQRPDMHKSGGGCNICSGNKLKTLEEFKEQASLKHNNFYDYRDFEYINSQTKSTIICPNHGSFKQNSNSHLNGTGCPKCFVRAGANRNDFVKCCAKNKGFGYLYIIECKNENESFYKIGITSNSIEKRFNSKTTMPYDISVTQLIYDKAETVFDMECMLHDYFKSFNYTPLLKFNGYTECFKLDVN